MRIKNSKLPNLKKDKSFLEIEDLIKSYEFAKNNELTEKNLLKSHFIMSSDLNISDAEKGKYRVGENEAIYGEEGLRYVAIETKYVKSIMREFFDDIDTVLSDISNGKLTICEVFYYSILIHLIFINIHPFRDGNGRISRLLQKWFLKSAFVRLVEFNDLYDLVWKIPFENYIFKNKNDYYKSLEIGINFYEINYSNSLPFYNLFINCLK